MHQETSIGHHGNLNNSHGESKASEEDTQEAQRTTNNYKKTTNQTIFQGTGPKTLQIVLEKSSGSFLLKAF